MKKSNSVTGGVDRLVGRVADSALRTCLCGYAIPQGLITGWIMRRQSAQQHRRGASRCSALARGFSIEHEPCRRLLYGTHYGFDHGNASWIVRRVPLAHFQTTVGPWPHTAKASPRSEHSFSALNAACVRLVAPIFRIMLRIWTFAVLSLMPSSCAIILLALPCCSWARTAFCRAVSR